jgi:glycosyltransferase involved in cell wall biosynthesis
MSPQRFLVISNMSHYKRNGEVVGWGPTVQELDHISSIVDELIHVCFLHSGVAPGSALPYSSKNVKTILLPAAGGQSIYAKMRLLRLLPLYARVVWREMQRADIIHVRAPASMALIAVILLALSRKPGYRWIKYAGNWMPEVSDGWSYGFQRWWLRKSWHRSLVTVNGEWPNQPAHVKAFINPSLTDEELYAARTTVRDKRLGVEPQLLFVGSTIPSKGLDLALQTVVLLRHSGVLAKLDVAGDGPNRKELEQLAMSLGLGEFVEFHGWVPRPELGRFYERAHFVLLPTKTEGWPKVISEGFAYGVVPIVTAVASIPQIIFSAQCGTAVAERSPEGFATAINAYMHNQSRWLAESRNGLHAASRFTYRAHIEQIRKAFSDYFGLALRAPSTSSGFAA